MPFEKGNTYSLGRPKGSQNVISGEVKKAFDIGAHNVVVGTAITRPHLITKRLTEAF